MLSSIECGVGTYNFMHEHLIIHKGYDSFLGVEVVSEEELVVRNKAIKFHWKDHGFKLRVPENALPEGLPELSINIKASLAGQFKLPEGYELVSAVYWFSFPSLAVLQATESWAGPVNEARPLT